VSKSSSAVGTPLTWRSRTARTASSRTAYTRGRTPSLGFGLSGHLAHPLLVVGTCVVPGLARLRCPTVVSSRGGHMPGVAGWAWFGHVSGPVGRPSARDDRMVLGWRFWPFMRAGIRRRAPSALPARRALESNRAMRRVVVVQRATRSELSLKSPSGMSVPSVRSICQNFQPGQRLRPVAVLAASSGSR
jgi:hypothetical protein